MAKYDQGGGCACGLQKECDCKEKMPEQINKRVRKKTGDYKFDGLVVACFYKRDGVSVRYVVENDDGILHIYSEKNLEFND